MYTLKGFDKVPHERLLENKNQLAGNSFGGVEESLAYLKKIILLSGQLPGGCLLLLLLSQGSVPGQMIYNIY